MERKQVALIKDSGTIDPDLSFVFLLTHDSPRYAGTSIKVIVKSNRVLSDRTLFHLVVAGLRDGHFEQVKETGRALEVDSQ